MREQFVIERLRDSINVKEKLINNLDVISSICELADAIVYTLNNDGKILICGNGGSASDSLHFAGELIGKFQKERQGFAAISLNSDVATITAIANDYGYDFVFSRQVDAIMNSNDILIGISTSGNSSNVVKAVEKASSIGGKTAVLTGKGGGILKQISDISIVVPSDITARIQEIHMIVYHMICEIVEDTLLE